MLNDPLWLGWSPTDSQTRQAEVLGFRLGTKGTHTSRTIMLSEFTTLMATSPKATFKGYVSLVVDDNCLGKRTAATRRLTVQRLSELYALNSTVFLFRIMRDLWIESEVGRPLLAQLISLARDPLLRLTAPPILRLRPGEELGRQSLTDALNRGTHGRFNDAVLDKVVRNTSSSWTQSGHLDGRNRKRRALVKPTPGVVTLALVIGYALGARGAVLFETLWAKTLDAGIDELISLATDAKRHGLLDLKASGGVVEVSFPRLLTEDERRLIHGTD